MSGTEIPPPSAEMWGQFDYVRYEGRRWYVNAMEPCIELRREEAGETIVERLPRWSWNKIELWRER
jgi:hypothetical protein